MDVVKVDAIASWPAPTNCHDVQVFLGFANFYRRFVYNFAGITKPLTMLLKKNSVFEWSADAQCAFDALKTAFVSPPILRHPDASRPFLVESDASAFAISAVLSQYDES